jgi:hypothetical protein
MIFRLKIVSSHDSSVVPDSARITRPRVVQGYPRIENIKTVFMQRQSLLGKNNLDPCFTKSVEEVLAALMPIKAEFQDMVIDDDPDEGIDVSKAFDVYKSFHHLAAEACAGFCVE